MKERRDRNEMLRILSEKKKRAFYDSQVGTQRTVIFEEGNVGFTENYVKVIAENAVANSVREVVLGEVNADGLVEC